MAAPSRVLIVGGGLAGPCLALCLAKHNIRSTIFEIRSTRSTSGGSITLAPNALKVLDRYAGVYENIKGAGFSYNKMGAYTQSGERLGEISVGTADKGADGYPALRIMRSKIHDVLLDAAEETSLIDVKYGATLTAVNENEHGVTVSFEDGTTATGDILIGADGVHSKVRKYVLGTDAPAAEFSGLCIVNGFLPRTSAQAPADFDFPAFMFTQSGLFMTIPIDPAGDTLAWGITRPTQPRTREEWRQWEISGEAARTAKAAFERVKSQPVRSILDAADEAKAKVWAPYKVPDLLKWHTSRVCLVGDAAHALPPNGQGSAMAFEDAAILTRILTENNGRSYDSLFAHFEALRRPRIQSVKKQPGGNAIRSGSGPWMYWLKIWAFRAYFLWKGGVIEFGTEGKWNVDLTDVKVE